ncbi:esterase/lipase family protein [Streptomyces californicus]
MPPPGLPRLKGRGCERTLSTASRKAQFRGRRGGGNHTWDMFVRRRPPSHTAARPHGGRRRTRLPGAATRSPYHRAASRTARWYGPVAALLGRQVEAVRARTGHDRVDIVGHSLGGLIARYYVQRLGGDRRVRTLVTLGTPHGGTAVAPGAGLHPIVRQMRGGSPVIEELRLPAPGCRTRFVSFWAELDQVMVPVKTACVDHPDLDAVNVRVTGIGHLALPVHPAVAAAVREVLETPETGEADVPVTGATSAA